MSVGGLYKMEADTQPSYAMARNRIHCCHSPLSANDGVIGTDLIFSDRVYAVSVRYAVGFGGGLPIFRVHTSEMPQAYSAPGPRLGGILNFDQTPSSWCINLVGTRL